MNYRVVWEIDIEAETPKAAAVKALHIQRDPESIATCFDVKYKDSADYDRAVTVKIDLLLNEEKPNG